jgi:hypothetical protein
MRSMTGMQFRSMYLFGDNGHSNLGWPGARCLVLLSLSVLCIVNDDAYYTFNVLLCAFIRFMGSHDFHMYFCDYRRIYSRFVCKAGSDLKILNYDRVRKDRL